MKTIRFYGRDYSLLENAEYQIDNAPGDTIELDDDFIIKLTPENIKRLVKAALDESEKVTRNSSKRENRERPLYEDYNGLRFGGYVGVIVSKIHVCRKDFEVVPQNELEPRNNVEYELEVILQIQSRFDTMPGKPFFLLTMLMMEPNLKLSGQSIPSSDDEFFVFLLIIRYKNCLLNAILKGYYRTYHTFENNDDHFRGSIDIARHIRENMGLNNGKIAYRYREKTIDNYLNHLIVAAYHYFKKMYPELTYEYVDSDVEVKRIINDLSNSIGYPKYDVRQLIMKNLTNLSHPYYTEYEALRLISLRILRNEGASIFDGYLDNTESILFYIPDLFENFVEGLFKKKNLKVKSQFEVKIFSYETNFSDYKQKTYPDYVFFVDNEKPFMVLDAKFKPEWGEKNNSSKALSSTKLLPDFDKCIRDMNSLNCHATGTVFPTNIEGLHFERHGISKYNSIDSFYTFPLNVPNNNMEYDDWKNQFRDSCETMLNDLNTTLETEEIFYRNIEIEMASIKTKRL